MAGFLIALALFSVALFSQGPGGARTTILDTSGTPVTFTGLDQVFSKDVKEIRLLYVHGMGEHPPGDSRMATDAIARALQLVVPGTEDQRVVLNLPGLPTGAEPAVLSTRTYAGKQGRLVIYEVSWWPLLYRIKAAHLHYETQHAGERVPINRALKQFLMNERLTDPVMYVGGMGPLLRNSVKHATCTLIDGTFDQTLLGEEDCTNPQLGPNTAIAVVTESLGSKITYDALDELRNDAPPAADRVHLQTTNMYLLANQLPLLELGSVGSMDPTPPKDTLQTFLDARTGRGEGELLTQRLGLTFTLVAISDPNDLLSYPLPPGFGSDSQGRFINVTTNIGRKYLVGLFAHPMQAHTGHLGKAHILRLIATGNAKNSP